MTRRSVPSMVGVVPSGMKNWDLIVDLSVSRVTLWELGQVPPAVARGGWFEASRPLLDPLSKPAWGLAARLGGAQARDFRLEESYMRDRRAGSLRCSATRFPQCLESGVSFGAPSHGLG